MPEGKGERADASSLRLGVVQPPPSASEPGAGFWDAECGTGAPFRGIPGLPGIELLVCCLSQKRAPVPRLVPLGLWLNFPVLASGYNFG